MSEEKKLLTVADVAKRLSVSTRTIQRLVAGRRLPVIRLGPRLIRFDPARIEQWIARSGARALRRA